MCRSATQYPPNGKRCGREHLTPAAREARRLKRNAREKELYYIRKARKAEQPVQGDTETIPPTVTTSAVTVHPDTLKPGGIHGDAYSSLKANREFVSSNPGAVYVEEEARMSDILAQPQHEVAYIPAKKLDKNFENGGGVNDVKCYHLEDGTVGYFKSYEGATSLEEIDGTNEFYGHTVLGSQLNEVAAYQFAQAMGSNYEGFVPVTVMKEVDGKLGTFQVEAPGVVMGNSRVPYRRLLEDKWADPVDVDRAFIMDYLMASQDRHAGNYAIKTTRKGMRVTMIDNGFAFSDGLDAHGETNGLNSNAISGNSDFINLRIDGISDDYVLPDEILGDVKHARTLFVEGGVMRKYLSPRSCERVLARCDRALKDGKVDDESYMLDYQY